MNKENLVSIDSLQNFLYGLKDTEYSKVYLGVEQKEGYNYLVVYLDNNYPNNSDINGLRKSFLMKMNPIEY